MHVSVAGIGTESSEATKVREVREALQASDVLLLHGAACRAIVGPIQGAYEKSASGWSTVVIHVTVLPELWR